LFDFVKQLVINKRRHTQIIAALSIDTMCVVFLILSLI